MPAHHAEDSKPSHPNRMITKEVATKFHDQRDILDSS
jgi:hypothetical protein